MKSNQAYCGGTNAHQPHATETRWGMIGMVIADGCAKTFRDPNVLGVLSLHTAREREGGTAMRSLSKSEEFTAEENSLGELRTLSEVKRAQRIVRPHLVP